MKKGFQLEPLFLIDFVDYDTVLPAMADANLS